MWFGTRLSHNDLPATHIMLSALPAHPKPYIYRSARRTNPSPGPLRLMKAPVAGRVRGLLRAPGDDLTRNGRSGMSVPPSLGLFL
jgi:hypothetical protein